MKLFFTGFDFLPHVRLFRLQLVQLIQLNFPSVSSFPLLQIRMHTLPSCSTCNSASCPSAWVTASLSPVAFFASASRSEVATSIAACLILILAVHGCNSFCLTSICSWKTCVLSGNPRWEQCGMIVEDGSTHPSSYPGSPRGLSLPSPGWPHALRSHASSS
jgi:hypothetical protein